MGFPWWVFVALLVLVAGGATAAILSRAGTRETDIRGHGVARVTRVVAIAWMAIGLVGTLIETFGKLYADTVWVDLPVEGFWPSLPTAAQVSGATAQVTSGGFAQAAVGVAGLDDPTRIWLASGDILQGATGIAIGMVVAVLCTSVIRQNPFHGALIRGINITAASVVVGGLGWQVCDAVAGGLASAQVLGIDGWTLHSDRMNWDDVNEIIGLPRPGYGWSVDFWPIWASLALLAVSAAFRHGQRLQKDTAGLV